MDIFRIENSVSDLDGQVDERFAPQRYSPCISRAPFTDYHPPCFRKKSVGRNTEELATLEARIKEMEDRLRRNAKPNRPRIPQAQGASADASKQQDAAAASDDVPPHAPPKDDKARSRPGTARTAQQAPGSGNMPPTPGASEGEYHLVTRADLDDRSR